MTVMDETDLAKLNPGIRRTVEWLNQKGFETHDSGDGRTHEFECDRDHPYVVIVVPVEKLVDECHRLRDTLEDREVKIWPIGATVGGKLMPCIQASYDPAAPLGILDVMHVDDDLLFDFIRASGDVFCEVCDKKYYDHPMDKEQLDHEDRPFLRIDCTGRRLKL
jgi:hypothetical protein